MLESTGRQIDRPSPCQSNPRSVEERAKKTHRRRVCHGPDDSGRAVEHQGGAQGEVVERSERSGRRCPALERVSQKEADRPKAPAGCPSHEVTLRQPRVSTGGEKCRAPKSVGRPRHAGARKYCAGSRRFPARCLRRGWSHRIVPGGPGCPVDERVASCARERPGLQKVARAKAESREDGRVADSKQRIGE